MKILLLNVKSTIGTSGHQQLLQLVSGSACGTKFEIAAGDALFYRGPFTFQIRSTWRRTTRTASMCPSYSHHSHHALPGQFPPPHPTPARYLQRVVP